ncbi:MAG TPA: VCBS repeat-containing protein [Pyrinomonadaceae bacterium]|nr:VCBS repeat-containing protein [Pyrinomonadaceae bacterium]
MATADFDGDGRPDLAAVDMGSDSLTVLTKLGTGAPPAINSFSAGHSPIKLSAGDFNGDGKPDLVVVNSDGILVLLNDGAGLFHAAGVVSPQTPQSMVVGDFNGDGKLDVAASVGNLLIVLLGNGSGGFSNSVFTSATVSQLAVGDFNGDGKLDLAGSGGPVQIFFGNGDGTFTRQPNSSAPISSANGIAAGDLNGDGKTDLVAVDVLSAKIQVLINNGSGCFAAGASFDVLNQGRPSVIALADLNNDGKRDIIAGTTVLLGDGSGNFGAPFLYGPSSGSATPGSNTVIADFDADGKLDLGTAGTNSVGILFGDGQGGFRFSAGPAGGGVFGWPVAISMRTANLILCSALRPAYRLCWETARAVSSRISLLCLIPSLNRWWPRTSTATENSMSQRWMRMVA